MSLKGAIYVLIIGLSFRSILQYVTSDRDRRERELKSRETTWERSHGRARTGNHFFKWERAGIGNIIFENYRERAGTRQRFPSISDIRDGEVKLLWHSWHVSWVDLTKELGAESRTNVCKLIQNYCCWDYSLWWNCIWGTMDTI